MNMALAATAARASRRQGDTVRVVACVLVVLVPVAISAAIAASEAASHPALVALGRAVIVGVPIAVGLYAWHAGAYRRFGVLLVVTGAACFVTTLAESSGEVAYTAGRSAGWLVEVLVVYLILSYPTGHLTSRVDRLLAGAVALVVLLLFLPRLALVEHFEVPSPYTSCVRDCPANALFLLGHQPAWVSDVMQPAGALAVAVVMIGVILRLGERIAHATPLARRVLASVLAVALARLGVLAVAILARHIDPSLPALRVAGWLLALAVPAVAVAFLVGLVSWEVFVGRALQRLARSSDAAPDAEALRRALGEALGDRRIELAFPAAGDGDASFDSHGRPLVMPQPGDGRSSTDVHRHGAVIARIIHDETLLGDPALLDASVAIAAVTLDNHRLVTQSEAAMRDVLQSRARIAGAAERERLRIERDLHDGAQQRLVALRIELELAEDVVQRDAEQGIVRLRELEGQLDDALEELRSLAHGIYPPLLADRGLPEAVRAAVARSTVPVELDVRGLRRYPPELESAVYFCVLEALQNVLKHAEGVHRVVVSLDGSRPIELRFSVRDDGAGALAGSIQPGAGMTNMRDRMAAVGGRLEITSSPNVGTLVRGRVPT